MIQELIISFVGIVLQILFGIVLSAGAIYSSMRLFDSLTPEIDEWKEIKKGNVAVGILFVSLMASIIMLLEPRIVAVVSAIRFDLAFTIALAALFFSLVNYIIGLLSGIVIIFLTINIIDRITPDLDEFLELKKGNIAVALILAAALILVVLALRSPVESAFDAIKLLESRL